MSKSKNKKMPTSQGQNADSDPVVKAAGVGQKGVIEVAVIVAAATVFVVVIVGLWQWLFKPSLPVENSALIIRVIDKVTEEGIRKAKVSVEGNGIPPVDSTDSEGVVSFPISNPTKELRIRIQAEGYEHFDLKVTPATNRGVQEARLAPMRAAFPSPSPSAISNAPGSSSASPIPANNNRMLTENASREEPSPHVRGKVIDAKSEEPIAGVRVGVDGYSKEALITGSDGEFDLPTHAMRDQMFQIRAEKEGYLPKEQWHQSGNQRATIRLVKK